MKKIIIIIIALTVLVVASLLRVFTVTTNELVAVGARDCFDNCPENYDPTIWGVQEVQRKGNFWEKILN